MYRTIVEYFYHEEERSGHSCGYCKGKNGNLSQGMWAHAMAVQDYEDLICRGWRRSGKYCYKPAMNKTCCPNYTIRCLVNQFKISKGQKNVLKKVHKYLNSGVKCKDLNDDESASTSTKSSSLTKEKPLGTSGVESVKEQQSKSQPQPGLGPDPNKPKCKKAKELRREKSQNKNVKKAITQPTQKSLQDFIEDIKNDGAHKLEIQLVRSNPRSDEFNQTFKMEYEVYKKYQTVIHKDKPSEVTEKQFTRFLIDSPLIEEFHENGIESGYGSFHQQYWIDGRLWMVGVIDILPGAISSVYLFYDPEFSFLSPGTYSALREIEFTRTLSAVEPRIQTYMMGFYIHSCLKMRYKSQYDPSFLLCPEVMSWHPIKECLPKLDISKYSRFAPEEESDPELNINLDKVLVLFEKIPTSMPYAVYREIKRTRGLGCDDEDEVTEYARLVGKTCAERMLLYRH